MKFLKQRKGQAFETMMLVISVIVALAILGILFGIIKNIPLFGSGDTQVVIKEELTKIAGTYNSDTPPREATLKSGTITTRDVTDGTTILPTWVKFSISDTLKNTNAVQLSLEDRTMRTTRDIKITIVVCGDPAPAGGGTAQYIVSIAPERLGLEASDNCLKALPGGSQTVKNRG